MASRLMANRVYTGKKDWKLPNVQATIGASGAATVVAAKSFGVISVTRDGTTAGLYTILFGVNAGGRNRLDSYHQFIGCDFTFVGAGGAASVVAAVSVTADNTADPAVATLVVQALDFAGSAVDPADGEIMLGRFYFADSDAP